MKKIFNLKTAIIFIFAVFLVSLVFLANTEITKAQDSELSSRLSGRILLQVESNGEAWYLNPDNNLRYFLNRPSDAFSIMRQLGLGISEDNYNIFKENSVPSKFSGRILLRVEASGEAYYVNPLDMTMHYLGRPADAFSVMKELGLGITNSNLDKIDRYNKENSNQGEQEDNNEQAEQRVITHKPSLMNNFSHIINITADIEGIDNILEKGILYKYTSTEDEQLIPSIEDNDQRVIDSSNSNTEINIDLSNLKSSTYPFIRAYVIDANNKVYYGNIETIDSLGKLGTPAMPMFGGVSEVVEAVEEIEEGEEMEAEPTQYTLTYRASEGGYVKLNDYPEWNEETEMPLALAGAGHLVLNDTQIFIAGGVMSNYLATTSVYIYDTETMEYSELNSMNDARSAFSITRIGNKIYVVDGIDNMLNLTNIHSSEVYDMETGEWEYISNTNYSRSGSVAVTYNNEIYSFGGFDYWLGGIDGNYNLIEKYNPILDEWTIFSTNFPIITSSLQGWQRIGDIIYFVGGVYEIGTTPSNDFSSYNLETEEWNLELPNLPEARMGGSLKYVNEKLLYFGGNNDFLSNASDYIYEYSFDTNEWRRIFNMPHTLSFSVVEVVGDHVYIIGGLNDNIIYDTNYKIDIDRLFFVEDEVSQIVFTGDETMEVYAIAETGYRFTMWSDENGNYVRKDDIESLTEENIILTANFEAFIPEFGDEDDNLVLRFNMSAGEELTLPVKDGLATPYGKDGYSFVVDWGDGATSTITSFDDEDISHTYSEAITAEIRIAGNFPWIYFNDEDASNKDNLIEVVQWGDVGFISFQNSFYGCSNLTTIPDGAITGAEKVESFSNTFNRTNLSSIPANMFINTPNVKNLYFTFARNNLSTIPSGLFDSIVEAIDFTATFHSNNIESIPVDLFINNENILNFGSVFQSNEISSIPEGLFDSNIKVFNFNSTFNNNLLTSIPEGLFDNNREVNNFVNTFSSNRLTSIPTELFNYTEDVTTFSNTFYNNLLTSIPEALFDYTLDVINFDGTFSNNNLNSIPESLFDNTENVKYFNSVFSFNNIELIPSGFFANTENVVNFSSAFRHNNLTEIPSGLFSNNVDVIDFSYSFNNNSLTTIPDNLFDNNFKVESFRHAFSENNINSIPDNLFEYTINVENFESTFSSNSISNIPVALFSAASKVVNFHATFSYNNITTIPSTLFMNNHDAVVFSNTFLSNSITLIPDNLFDNNLNVSNFYGTFYNNISLSGDAPDLWTRSPEPDGRYCFGLATGLTNYDDIPFNWK